jgi:hypothetical protein
MKNSLATSNFTMLRTQPVQVVPTNPNPVEPPSSWIQYGTSPTEIILAIAFLLKVLVPVIQSNSSHKKS